MPRLNFRPAEYIPLEYRREVLKRFTKADLAEIAWDLALQTLGGESSWTASTRTLLGNRVLTELVRRRDVVRAATHPSPRADELGRECG